MASSLTILSIFLVLCCFAPSVFGLVNCTRKNLLLSQARYDLAVAAACDRVYIAGGQNGSGYPEKVEVYNTKAGSFEASLVLPNPRPWLAAAATKTKVLFIGGGISGSPAVDVYDCSANSWTLLTIPGSAEITNLAAAGTPTSGIIVFGGGYGVGIPSNGYLSGLYVYNATSNSITTSAASMNPPRKWLAAAAYGNKVLFGGGEAPSLTAPGSGPPYSSNKIEAYDITTDTITDSFNFTQQSGRQQLAAASAGGRISFGGGNDRTKPNPNEAYDADTWNSTDNQLYFEQLNRNRDDLAGAGDGTVLMFAGGTKGGVESTFVDIFDVASNQWTAANMVSARTQLAGAAINNVFVFAGGFNSFNTASNGAMRDVDIFECSYAITTTTPASTTSATTVTTAPGTTTAPSSTKTATSTATTKPLTAASTLLSLTTPLLVAAIALVFA